MSNAEFLKLVASSFVRFLETSARSNEKLKILHGQIAGDIQKKLGAGYLIQSLGIGAGKEGKMSGRYMDKVVDILISKEEEDVAAVGLKFVMNNYSQNSNNYFENMLGETANLRANKKKYFQIFILPEVMPYYDNKGNIKKWEKVTNNNLNKYIALSKDDVAVQLHVPTKTLLFIVKFPDCNHDKIKTRKAYVKYYLGINNMPVQISVNETGIFGGAIILNNYEDFIEKLVHDLGNI